MSLINDALKRARVEALRQEAERQGVEYRTVPAHSRRGSRLAAQLAGWTVAAIAVGLLLWVSMRGGDRQSPSAVADPGASEARSAAETREPGVPPTQAPDTAPAESGALGAEPPRGGVGLGVSPALEVASPSTPDPDAAPRLSGSPAGSPAIEAPPLVESTAGNAPPEPDAAAGRGARVQGEARLEKGASYLRRATAADGSTVELGGIAYSAERPIAVINGAVVSPGDLIAGFTIVGIEPERVELEADGVRIFLSLR